jgi:cobalt-zinc-cadmium efflux system protein
MRHSEGRSRCTSTFPPRTLRSTVPHAHDDHHGHGHDHAISADADRRLLSVALGLILAFMAVEVGVGIAAHSLALLSDAAHMLTDAAAIGLALVAIGLAQRPARGAFTFGLRRAEILSAQFNGATLLVLGVLVVVEGLRRLVNPPDVEGGPVLVVALVGIAVNVAATWQLARANRTSLNIEGAYQHLLTDLLAFIATAIAGAVVLLTGFRQADGLAALFVAATMLRAAYSLLRESGRIFLEAAPRGMDVQEIGLALASARGVVEVHDLHVWEVSSGFPALAAHVVVGRDCDCHDGRRRLEAMLHERFGIEHTTLQMDHEGGDLVQLELTTDVSPATPAPR